MVIEFLKRRSGDIASMVIAAIISAGLITVAAAIYATLAEVEWFKPDLPAGAVLAVQGACPEGWVEIGRDWDSPNVLLCGKLPPSD